MAFIKKTWAENVLHLRLSHLTSLRLRFSALFSRASALWCRSNKDGLIIVPTAKPSLSPNTLSAVMRGVKVSNDSYSSGHCKTRAWPSYNHSFTQLRAFWSFFFFFSCASTPWVTVIFFQYQFVNNGCTSLWTLNFIPNYFVNYDSYKFTWSFNGNNHFIINNFILF